MRNLRIEAETEGNGCLCDGLTDKNGEHHYFCSGEQGERGGIVAGARIYRIYNQSSLPLAPFMCRVLRLHRPRHATA
jgi:hypothetical protein